MTCPFCNLSKSDRIIFDSDNFIFFSDANPIINGHSLLIPKAHIREEIEIPKPLFDEYIEVNKKAYNYIKKEFANPPLTFINAPQDQSIRHLHKHFIPGKFGPLGLDKALRNFLKAR